MSSVRFALAVLLILAIAPPAMAHARKPAIPADIAAYAVASNQLYASVKKAAPAMAERQGAWVRQMQSCGPVLSSLLKQPDAVASAAATRFGQMTATWLTATRLAVARPALDGWRGRLERIRVQHAVLRPALRSVRREFDVVFNPPAMPADVCAQLETWATTGYATLPAELVTSAAWPDSLPKNGPASDDHLEAWLKAHHVVDRTNGDDFTNLLFGGDSVTHDSLRITATLIGVPLSALTGG